MLGQSEKESGSTLFSQYLFMIVNPAVPPTEICDCVLGLHTSYIFINKNLCNLKGSSHQGRLPHYSTTQPGLSRGAF